MSSTDSDAEAKARAFFRERLTPVAETIRGRGERFFALAPEPTSAWKPHEVRAADELEEVLPSRERLEEIWKDTPDLAGLAGALLDLANEMRPKESDDREVSPFIYVMF